MPVGFIVVVVVDAVVFFCIDTDGFEGEDKDKVVAVDDDDDDDDDDDTLLLLS